MSADRFAAETGWSADWLDGKWVLDAGCGAGRFLDIASRSKGEIVGVDISDAVDAAAENLSDRTNVHLVQASLFALPFKPATFDACYCIGVLQHTPDALQALRLLPRVLRPDGRLAITAYERKPWTRFNAKYLARPITRRIDKVTLLRLIQRAMPVIFPLTTALFQLPYLGRVFRVMIPVANYVDEPQLDGPRRYEWALLDTFDMLSPRYDRPLTAREVVAALTREVGELTRRPSSGLNIIGAKRREGSKSPS